MIYTLLIQAGLLGPRTILAHGVHLTQAELTLLRTSRAGVAHCPNSNFRDGNL